MKRAKKCHMVYVHNKKLHCSWFFFCKSKVKVNVEYFELFEKIALMSNNVNDTYANACNNKMYWNNANFMVTVADKKTGGFFSTLNIRIQLTER